MSSQNVRTIIRKDHAAYIKLKQRLDSRSIQRCFYRDCCIGIVDMVNSTKIASSLTSDAFCRYYDLFLSTMAFLVQEFNGMIVKNIGDSLLYYFPYTFNSRDSSAFKDAVCSSVAMIEVKDILNEKLTSEKLPSLSYRVSLDYGKVSIMPAIGSLTDDLFGSPVNFCSKINHSAKPYGIVIGGDLYNIIKGYNEFKFRIIDSFNGGQKYAYPVYQVFSR